ncbi:hypothetical protein K0M31_016626, partial [Melipona bicolor]
MKKASRVGIRSRLFQIFSQPLPAGWHALPEDLRGTLFRNREQPGSRQVSEHSHVNAISSDAPNARKRARRRTTESRSR